MRQVIPREIEEKPETIPDSNFIRYANGEIGTCKPIEIQGRGAVLNSPAVFKYSCSETLSNSNLPLNNVSSQCSS
jgi:hypothetical protein